MLMQNQIIAPETSIELYDNLTNYTSVLIQFVQDFLDQVHMIRNLQLVSMVETRCAFVP